MTTNVILVDTSSSMTEPANKNNTISRIDAMRDILRTILERTPKENRVLISFASHARVLKTIEDLPPAYGSTNLLEALQIALPFEPSRLIVISDGEPTGMYDQILDFARNEFGRNNCEIVTYFCGTDDSFDAIQFLRELAWCSADGLGQASFADLSDPRQLTNEVLLLIEGPQL